MGEVRGVVGRFGGQPQLLRQALEEMQRRLYASWETLKFLKVVNDITTN